jgi:hypothetical protein
VKAVLVNTAVDIATADIPNNNEGFGRVLLDDALYFDGDTRELRAEMDDGVSTGEVRTFEYEIDSSAEPFEVALVWSDYPAAAGAGIAIVNDLDLVVTAPGGAVYLGNRLVGGQSATGGSLDRRNVEEIFRLDNPPVGVYSIEVRGFNVPQGPQTYALVARASFGTDPGPGPGQQLLANPGFESGATGWTGTTASITNSTTRPARGGSFYAGLGGNGSTSTENVYQQIAVPATGTPSVSFWARIDTAETTSSTQYDKLQLQVLNSAGTVLGTLATLSNLDKSTAYSQKTFDLSAYKGQTIRIRWQASEDSSLQTTFAIDDTAVNVS